jgi:hypothetical protein
METFATAGTERTEEAQRKDKLNLKLQISNLLLRRQISNLLRETAVSNVLLKRRMQTCF